MKGRGPIAPICRVACLWVVISVLAAVGVGLWCPVSMAETGEAWLERVRGEQTGVDFSDVALKFPRFKTIVLLVFQPKLDFERLIRLLDLGVQPLGDDSSNLLGRSWAVCHTRAARLDEIKRSGVAREVIPLTRFRMSGIYRIHFKIVEPEFNGPISFRVSAPREGFGKTLLAAEEHVRPDLPLSLAVDDAGNRWFEVRIPDARHDQSVHFDFFFRYQVDVGQLLEHALPMAPGGEGGDPPDGHPALSYLASSPKIDATLPEIRSLAARIFGDEKDPRTIYLRLNDYLQQTVRYDSVKREQFFGGMKVYRTMAEWRGWVSTSVTPTGIPLVVDPGERHEPFVRWDPAVAVQTTLWSGSTSIDLEGPNE
ncbi:MAG: hypothetical protein HY788_22040 [Deltaproteobacteria bacterium]|nr:hypothetical protein [Deltaproteobacteria bacterium]